MMTTLFKVFVCAGLAAVVLSCQAPREPLRVGLLVWPPYDLAYVAEQDGFIDDQAIAFIEFQSPAEAVRSYRHDLIDAIFVTTQFALSNIDSMADTKIVYVVDFSTGGDSLLARPGIEKPEDLKGKRVGVEAAPLGAYMLIRALGMTGLTLDDVETVFVDTPEQFAAFKDGRIDAVAVYEPVRTRMLNAGANEIFNSRSMPLEIIDALLAKKRTIESRRDQLAALVDGLDRALQKYRADPDRIARRMADRHAMTAEEFKRAMNTVELLDLETNARLLAGQDDRLRKGLLRQCRVMKKAGLLRTIPDLEPLLERSIVSKAMSAP